MRFRSRHRGTKELDLLLGGFADERLETMNEAELDRFETLLELPEPVLGAWLVGGRAPPPEYDNEVTRALLAFRPKPGGA